MNLRSILDCSSSERSSYDDDDDDDDDDDSHTNNNILSISTHYFQFLGRNYYYVSTLEFSYLLLSIFL